MIEVAFEPISRAASLPLKYVVITARYRDKWVFVRHKQRRTWEIPGGHIEIGEVPEAAAKRELWEETGTVKAEMHPVSVYGVTRDGNTTYGMLFFARILELETLPEEFEIAEMELEDHMPADLTYPDIQPALFERVQGWINLQSGAGELWDVYDENRRLTGRTHRRGVPLEKGEYHLVVYVWMLNSRGEFLVTKRSPNKGFANMWESTGGSALAGDDSLTAALREVKEKTGLTLDPDRGTRIATYRRADFFGDVWLFRQDFALSDVVLQPGETIDKAYMGKETIRQLFQRGEFVPYDYLEEVFAAADLA